jgi:hypothetical protein
MYSCSISPILAMVCDAVALVPAFIFGARPKDWKFRQEEEEGQGTLGESETWDESYVRAGGCLFLFA